MESLKAHIDIGVCRGILPSLWMVMADGQRKKARTAYMAISMVWKAYGILLKVALNSA